MMDIHIQNTAPSILLIYAQGQKDMGNTDNCKPAGEVSGEDKPRLSQPVSLENAKQLGCLKIQRNDVTVLKHLEVEIFFCEEPQWVFPLMSC